MSLFENADGERKTRCELALERAQKLARFGSWSFDYNTGMAEGTEVAREIYGLGEGKYSIEEVRQIPLPEYREMLEGELRRCQEAGGLIDCEFAIRRPSDGEIRYVHSVAEYDAEKNELCGSIQDITEWREAEQIQAALSAFIDTSTDIIVVKDRNRRVIATNPAFAHATGRETVREMIGKTDAEIFGIGEDAEPIRSYMLDDLTTLRLKPGEAVVREEPVLFPDGKARTFLTRKFPVPGPNGEVEAIGIISVDISPQKEVEQALREREAQYRSLAEDLPLMMSRFTPDHRWTYVNPAFGEFHGYCPKVLEGKNWLDYLDDQQVETQLEGLSRIGPAHPVVVKEMVYPDHAKGRRIVRWFYRGIYDTEGRLVEYRAIGEDVTRYKDLEQHLIRAKEAAQRASEAKSDFLATMSHEIRTPLNGVIGMADFLRSTNLPKDVEANIAVIYQAGFHLLDLINDILDFSKIEAGRLVMQFGEANLPDTLEELCAFMQQRSEAKKLTLNLRVNLSASIFVIDVIRLRQVLVNLIGNAIKFTDEGGWIEVAVSDAEEGWLVFSVKDNGCGIEADKVGKLFEPFVQADGSINKKFGGTGLGLSICKRIVEKMGGGIEVESEYKKGSCFRFWIRSDKAKGEQPAAVVRGRKLDDERQGRGLRALVVDDDENNALVLGKLLGVCGMETEELADVGAAMRRLAQKRFDVVFLDLNIPGRSGMELAEMIRAGGLEATPADQYLVAYTASATERVKGRCDQVGFNDFLAKPVSMVAVRKMLDCYWDAVESIG